MSKYTPGVKILDQENRIFSSWGSVEVLDRQNDFLSIEDLTKILGIMEQRGAKGGAPITIGHSNAIVGHTLEQTPCDYVTKEGKKIPAVWLVNQIFKDYPIDDEAWEGIVRADDPTYIGQKYTGMSLGGRGKRHIFPGCKGESCPTIVKNMQGLEWSLAVKPANQLAVICKEFSDMEVIGFDEGRAVEIAKAIIGSNQVKEEIRMDEQIVKDLGATLDKLTQRIDAIEKSLLVQKEAPKEEKKDEKEDKKDAVCKEDIKLILDAVKVNNDLVTKQMEKFANSIVAKTEVAGFGEIKKELGAPPTAGVKPRFKTPQEIMKGG